MKKLLIFQGHVHIQEDSDTDMIIDHRELSIGEDSISTVSHAAAQNTDKIGLTEVWIQFCLKDSIWL